MGKHQDLTGRKFGHWTVLYRIEETPDNKIRYMCECDCAKKTKRSVIGANLISGRSQSCGCTKKSYKKRENKPNQYIFHENYVEGLGKHGKSFYVDYEDYEKIKDLKWTVNNKGYWIHCEYKKKSIYLHRFIMGNPEGYKIDHKDQNPSNNRKSNLRLATTQNNRFNTKPSKLNKSGIIGVHYSDNRWHATIKINNKKITLGSFINKEDAIIARLKGEIKYLDIEFAPNRELFKKYNLI